jgi:hypothetical protein
MTIQASSTRVITWQRLATLIFISFVACAFSLWSLRSLSRLPTPIIAAEAQNAQADVVEVQLEVRDKELVEVQENPASDLDLPSTKSQPVPNSKSAPISASTSQKNVDETSAEASLKVAAERLMQQAKTLEKKSRELEARQRASDLNPTAIQRIKGQTLQTGLQTEVIQVRKEMEQIRKERERFRKSIQKTTPLNPSELIDVHEVPVTPAVPMLPVAPTAPVANRVDFVTTPQEQLGQLQAELRSLLGDLGLDHTTTKQVTQQIKDQEARAELSKRLTIVITINPPEPFGPVLSKVLKELYGEKAKIVVDESSDIVLITFRNIQASAAESLIAQVEANVKQLSPDSQVACHVNIENEQVKGSSISAQKERPAILPTTDSPFLVDDRDIALDRQTKQLASQLRTATPENKSEIRKALNQVLETQFEHRQQRRQQEFESLAKRIEGLKGVHSRRQANKSNIIERRLTELLDSNADLNWDASTPTESASVRQPAKVDEPIAQPRIASVPAPGSNTTTSEPPTTNKSDPTYNGVTLSEWLKLLQTERNPTKIAESVVAMNYLIEDADPKALIQTILNVTRIQKTPYDVTGMAISQGSILLLVRLPSELVVEEILADLRSADSQTPTHDVLWTFFGTIEADASLRNIHHISGFQYDYVRLRVSAQQLNQAIEKRSEQLIDSFVAIAKGNDAASEWAIGCAKNIVRICQHPLTRYPELTRLVDERFTKQLLNENLWESQKANLPDEAIFLGAAGLRVPEIYSLAARLLEKGNPQFRAGIDYLVAIAPHHPEAATLLNDKLQVTWNSLAELLNQLKRYEKSQESNDGSDRPYPDLTNQPKLFIDCLDLVDALGKIGTRAIQYVPDLREIANSEHAIDANPHKGQGQGPDYYRATGYQRRGVYGQGVAFGGGMMGVGGNTSLRDRINNTIKQIEKEALQATSKASTGEEPVTVEQK